MARTLKEIFDDFDKYEEPIALYTSGNKEYNDAWDEFEKGYVKTTVEYEELEKKLENHEISKNDFYLLYVDLLGKIFKELDPRNKH